ncbi:Conserved_hypothetical protein [Hexamita inflata]|uniref:Transmembrane protein n=1 Tax=Hexamita inflata TaxID=28002 RepID=A0AA86Q8G3_9EUKA|nr:Conserved hypothetical protein [Hexamita inflata]
MLVVLSLQFTTQEMIEPDVILLPQQAQNLTLKKQETVVVGVQVPAPVNIDQQNSFYSQLAFQARAAVDFDCQIKFIGFQTNQTYAKYNNSDIFKTFAILLTQEQNEKSQFVYVNVSSSCDVQVELVVAAVHLLDFSVQSLTKQQPESTIFVHRKARGINRRVQIEIDTDSMVMIYVCSTPLILDLAWMDCKYYISEGKEIFNIEVETSLYDPNIEYIYYTVAYCNDQNKRIKANAIDVVELRNNSMVGVYIYPYRPEYFHLSKNITGDAYINISKLDSKTSLCVTSEFTYTNINCTMITLPGKTALPPNSYILIRTQAETGEINFKVIVEEHKQNEKQQNINWIIWTVLGSIFIVFGIAVLVFFFLKHKKQQNAKDQQIDELVSNEK